MPSRDVTSEQIRVSVAWAEGDGAHEIEVVIASGTSLAQLRASPVFQATVPAAILADAAGLGVWARVRPDSYVLRSRDRVEIYQPLRADPKEQRRRRAR